MIFVTSDHHFGHANIVKMTNRPFLHKAGGAAGEPDVLAMNDHLIREWNTTVTPLDDIWHLGDLIFGDRAALNELGSKLTGDKLLLRGNHDRWGWEAYREAGFQRLSDKIQNGIAVIDVGEVKIIVSHKPPSRMQAQGSFDLIPEAKLWLHGHAHGKGPFIHKNVVDMSVECWDYRPVALPQLLDGRRGKKVQ